VGKQSRSDCLLTRQHTYIHTNLYSAKNRENESEANLQFNLFQMHRTCAYRDLLICCMLQCNCFVILMTLSDEVIELVS